MPLKPGAMIRRYHWRSQLLAYLDAELKMYLETRISLTGILDPKPHDQAAYRVAQI